MVQLFTAMLWIGCLNRVSSVLHFPAYSSCTVRSVGGTGMRERRRPLGSTCVCKPREPKSRAERETTIYTTRKRAVCVFYGASDVQSTRFLDGMEVYRGRHVTSVVRC